MRPKRVATFAPVPILAAALSFAGDSVEPSTSAIDLVLRGVTVLSPEDGSALIDRDVQIAGDSIVAVMPTGETPPSADTRVVDADGHYVIPGLWDLHTHLSFADPNAAPLMITQGVTGARDMGAVPEEIEAIRARISSGELLGPRIVRAGPTLNGAEYGPHQRLIHSPEAARAAVAELDALGIDFLKTHNETGRDTYFALVEAATAAGLDVVGHVPKEVDPLEACQAGQRSIDHIVTIFEGTYLSRFPSELEAFQSFGAWIEEEARPLVDCFVSRGVLFVPTLSTYEFRAHRAANYDDPPRERMYLTAENQARYQEELVPSAGDRNPVVIQLREGLVEVGKTFTRMLHEAGAPVGAGTDFAGAGPLPGFSLHREIELLAEAGIPPRAVIHAATRGPGSGSGAHALTGRIEAGAPADLVLLRANPFEDLGAMHEIDGVLTRGRWLDREELDRVLEELARR